MRFLITALIALAIALSSLADAQPVVREPTNQEVWSAQGAAKFREREAFIRALFGSGRIPGKCDVVQVDPASTYHRMNLALVCPEVLTYCDALGIECGGSE